MVLQSDTSDMTGAPWINNIELRAFEDGEEGDDNYRDNE